MAKRRASTVKAKKPTAKTKRKRSGKPQTFSFQLFKVALYTLFVLVLIALSYQAGYQVGYDTAKAEDKNAFDRNASRIHELEMKLKKEQLRVVSARHEYEAAPPKPLQRVKKKAVKTKKAHKLKKPMLAIIFDDVSFSHDVRHIKALKMPVTMSFLPPTKGHPGSAKLASKEPFYMVHLPLQAMSYAKEEPYTLHVGDSYHLIEKRVRRIKALYPRVKYVNNHTGSRFTADKTAMRHLIKALDREGITFIDSRTTSQTVVPGIMKALKRDYIGRDVFLDHDHDVESVKKQVAYAIRLAKKSGYAIAIGHPHKNTLKGIAASAAILQDVEMVRIDRLVQAIWP